MPRRIVYPTLAGMSLDTSNTNRYTEDAMSYSEVHTHKFVVRDVSYGISKGVLLIYDAQEQRGYISVTLGLDRFEFELDKADVLAFVRDVRDLYEYGG